MRVLLWQILAKPDTFRDEVLPEEEPMYAAASKACAQMWDRHKRDHGC